MKIINNSTYVDYAENAIRMVHQDKRNKITTTQIRNLLSMTADIYNDVLNSEGEKLTQDILARIEYLKVHIIYAAGRSTDVRSFVDKAKILEILKSLNGSRSDFILFSHYMEALVAFHRYYDGRD